MSDSSEEDRWKIAVQKIEDIELLTELENRTTDLYDPNFVIQIMMMLHMYWRICTNEKRKLYTFNV